MKEILSDKMDDKRPLPLEEMALALRSLGSPHQGMRYVHIAGTNGKGSTAAFLESILRRAGYVTGLFTSPHISKYNERIRVNGVQISGTELDACLERVRCAFQGAGIRPNYFQIATAAAFAHFKRESCDIVILETGLGGRLDPTNVIQAPELAVITRIGKDHTALLGGEIAQIAFEKAGIIKRGSDVVYIAQEDEAERVILDAAKQNTVKRVEPLEPGEYKLGIGGGYQLENAALAIESALSLTARGYRVSECDIREGLERASWEARFEIVCEAPRIVLDGAHNPQAVRALIKSLKAKWPGKRFVFVVGFMKEKDYMTCVSEAAEISRAMIAVEAQSENALDKSLLKTAMGKCCTNVYEAKSVSEGLDMGIRACGRDDVICVFGSLYLAASVKDYVRGMKGRV